MLSTFALSRSRNSQKMAAELVNTATSDKLAEMDWTKNIEICELAANDQKAAKDVVKAIKKRLGSSNSNTQLYAVMLLELLMNNIGERIHKLVTESGILPILVKIVKKKNDFPVRERIFLLLDATQTSLGGSSGKFPQYYTAYYDLVKAGVKFPRRAQSVSSDRPTTQTGNDRPLDHPTTQTSNHRPLDLARRPNSRTHSNGELPSSRDKPAGQEPVAQPVPESSIIQKASNALEVLKDVLDAAAAQNPAAAKDEFTLDLVEQCSFQKQRVMHLVMTSRNEKLVSQAIELNENLQNVLERHEAILSGRSDASVATGQSNNQEPYEEEEEEQLFRRIRKGKACMRPENEQPERDLYEPCILGDRQNRPIIRPLSLEPRPEPNQPHHPAVVIPPPPAKHVERQRFFKENKLDGPGSGVLDHMKGLSLHSRNASRAHGEGVDSME